MSPFGSTYDEKLDGPRLKKLRHATFHFMEDSRWHSPDEIQSGLGFGSTQGITARLREFREAKYGGWDVLARRRAGQEHKGVWEYRMPGTKSGIKTASLLSPHSQDNLKKISRVVGPLDRQAIQRVFALCVVEYDLDSGDGPETRTGKSILTPKTIRKSGKKTKKKTTVRVKANGKPVQLQLEL